MKRPLVLGLVALTLVGAGNDGRRFGDLRITATGHVQLTVTPSPHFEGPGANIADVAFVSPRVGVVATRHEPGLPRARIQRTTDGGDTWHDVVVGHGRAASSWLAVSARRTLYAGGVGPDGHPALLVSEDAGLSWKMLRPELPHGRDAYDDWLQSCPTFVTPSFAYTVPDPASFSYGAFLRTRDGGRTWQRLHVPRYTVGIQFVDERRGFAAGSVEHRCNGAVWRTNDAGASWTRIMCERVPLAAVQFLDTRHGYAAGGWAG